MARPPSRPSKPQSFPVGQNPESSADGRGAVPPPPVPPDSAEAARYIEAFTLELTSIAKRSRLDFLAYLLDMARMEAERIAKIR